MIKSKKYGIILGVSLFILLIIGATYAIINNDTSLNITSGNYGVVYKGEVKLPNSKLEPVIDTELLKSENANKVMKIHFTVKGAETNAVGKNVIYDVALTNINMPKELLSKYLKWRLYKNGSLLNEGTFEAYNFDSENKMLLTNTEEDLPSYSEQEDSYDFYIWISEACVGDITKCKKDMDVSELLNKSFSGEIEIELSTGSKKYKNNAKDTLVKLGLEKDVKITNPDITKPAPYLLEDGSYDYKEVGIYINEDDQGETYYFRGTPENNYVYFGGFYWRIVRINGDGSIRIVYDGTSPHKNGEASEDRVLEQSVFNETIDDNAYVGYKYGNPNSSTYEDTHTNAHDSTIKMKLDLLYKNYIENTKYEQYIVDNIFCNGRSLVYGTGIGKTYTFYSTGEYTDFKCPQKNDRFTVSTDTGNGALTYPIGLLTANDVQFAGAKWAPDWGSPPPQEQDKNKLFYLYVGGPYWLLSPYDYNPSGWADITVVLSDGTISAHNIANTFYIKPVISVKAEALQYGKGTMNDPFRLESAI